MGKVRKLVVEVISAHNLMPKDGQGSSSAFVEVDYDNQRTRTRTQKKNLNPVWNEPLMFDVPNPMNLKNQCLQICVFHEKNAPPGRKFLGKVEIHGRNIVKHGVEIVQKFTLEKRGLFSPVKGDIELKIYSFDEEEKKKSGGGGGGGEKIPQIEWKEEVKQLKQEKPEKVQEATEKSVLDEAKLQIHKQILMSFVERGFCNLPSSTFFFYGSLILVIWFGW
ncbi:hypothetical protein SUGI_0439830 [Cryptomeria japonica]|uniref:multiple C2 domain and transmembrane region protein 10 n=1 Tax=Cryptomeria japonica TaxID=3369 RepID=UPI002408C795|nr:multiple C2 domain and transmembrane region protein 10 [Cryptomeria japonica]XP_057832689.2 multiple C2 domain and transmembrane region protein 10 [Cryptomeria japonica]XP_059076078.1 multiple C2 domain and transmembrane region protein 10 [Cryptomeria japonica]GLJ23252.1 hypothetical protein SUGI_0439830 [Cryptomeria japonica]